MVVPIWIRMFCKFWLQRFRAMLAFPPLDLNLERTYQSDLVSTENVLRYKEKENNDHSYIYGPLVQCQALLLNSLHYYPISSSQLYEISMTTAPVFREKGKKPLRCREVKNLAHGHPIVEQQTQDLNPRLHILVSSSWNNKML